MLDKFNYQMYFNFEVKPKLHGLDMHIELDHTEDKDQQMYANWSFPNFTVWNDYYFSDNRT